MPYTFEQTRYLVERSLVKGKAQAVNWKDRSGAAPLLIRREANQVMVDIYPTSSASGINPGSYENMKFEYEQDFLEGYKQAGDWDSNRTFYINKADSFAANLLSTLYPTLIPSATNPNPTGPAVADLTLNQLISLGFAYKYSNFATLGNAEILEFVVTTPPSPSQDTLIIGVTTSAAAEFRLFEGATAVVGGTPRVPFNINRRSTNLLVATIVENPTSLVEGTLLEQAQLGFAGQGNTTVGDSGDTGLVLQFATAYLIRLNSLAAGNAVNFEIVVTEQPN